MVAWIKDDAVFRAREYIVDDRRYPTDSGPGPGIEEALKPFDGRHRFWLNATADARNGLEDTTHTRHYAILRIDAENLTISGDLHTDIHRKIWKLSWRSVALFQIDRPGKKDRGGGDWDRDGWNVFAICDVFAADTGFVSNTSLAVALRLVGKRIEAARLIQTDGKGRIWLDLSRTDSVDKDWYSFRYLQPIHIADNRIRDDEARRKCVEAALGADGQAMGRLLQDSARIFWQDDTIALDYVGDGTPFELITPYQWSDDPDTYTIMFSSEKVDIFGTVLELAKDETPLSKVRFGAVIYVQSIIDSVLERAESSDWRDNLETIVRHIRRTYVHELGHLLNLPHTWQRSRFPVPPMRSDPAARSWMAYASRFPLGDFMKTSREHLARRKATTAKQVTAIKKCMRRDDAARSNETALAAPHFTAEEKAWLWHAPFDHIAPGGPYFTARTRSPRQLKHGNSKAHVRLSIELWDVRRTDRDGTLVFAQNLNWQFRRQQVFGEVVLDVSPDYARELPFHFAFQSPMLELCIREEFPDRDSHDPRRVLEVPAPPVPADWVIQDDKGWLDANLARRFHSAARMPAPGTKDPLQYRRFTPFFHPHRFTAGFKPKCNDFTLQAVLRPLGKTAIYSDPVRIRFKDLGLSCSDQDGALLADPMLGRYIDAVSFFRRDLNVAKLARPDPHSTTRFHNVFGGLIKKISVQDWPTDVSPAFFEFLAGVEWVRLNYVEKLGTPPPPMTDRTRRLLRHHLQTDPVILADFDTLATN